MSIDDLKALVAVIDHASITRAANALSLTQSAISRRIQHLEETLGADLFDRQSKPPRATALAQRIYAHAVPLLRDVDRLLDVPRENAMPSGLFRLGLSQVVADVALFDAIVGLKTAFPALDVQVHSDWSTELIDRVAAGTLDAATLLLPCAASPPDGLRGERIATLQVSVVQSKRQPLINGSVGVADLAAQQWVLNPEGCGYRAALERAMASSGRHVRLSVDTHGTDMQLRLVTAGLGLGLVPNDVLHQNRFSDMLSVVDVVDFDLTLAIWLIHARQPGNLARALETLSATLHASIAALKYGEDDEGGSEHAKSSRRSVRRETGKERAIDDATTTRATTRAITRATT